MDRGAPIDPDIDLTDPAQRREAGRWGTLAAISAGGMIGALARYGLGLALPTAVGHFPWAMAVVNVSGCLAMGVIMVLVTEVWSGRGRPFLAVGILGGYTSVSAYAVDIHQLVAASAPVLAVLYLFGTVIAALVAVSVGGGLTRRALTRRPGRAGAGGRTR